MITPESFNCLVWCWIATAIIVFPFTLKLTAPYGRHSKTGWGPMISNRLAWIIMELPSLLVFSFFVIKDGNLSAKIVQLGFLLWAVHYFNRSVIFPLRTRTSGKKMPVSIMAFAFFFNLVNGFVNGYWLGNFAPEYAFSPDIKIRIIAGIIVFAGGFAINQYHDTLLIGLRKNKEAGYQIPYGGLFRFVSCPNFLGEIIEWAGFLIVVFSLPAFSFLLWSIVNLVPRALDHHRWYKNTFSNYPTGRKAIIPYVL